MKCSFEINGPNYWDGWECLMKLLSKQTNLEEGHLKRGNEDLEVTTGEKKKPNNSVSDQS